MSGNNLPVPASHDLEGMTEPEDTLGIELKDTVGRYQISTCVIGDTEGSGRRYYETIIFSDDGIPEGWYELFDPKKIGLPESPLRTQDIDEARRNHENIKVFVKAILPYLRN